MKFHIWQDKKGEWRWQLKSRGRIIAEAGESYKHRYHALRMCARINPAIPVIED